MRPGDKIGEGSSRIVYTYSNTKVIKMSKNLAGRRQNENEASIEKSIITPTVYKHAPDFDWIVTDHVHPITKNTFESLLGIPPNDFYNYACNYIEDKIPCDQNIIDTFRHIFKQGCVVPLELFDTLRPAWKSNPRSSI